MMKPSYSIQPNNVQEMVYQTLRNRIIHLDLLPGTPISTQEVADQMETSRTPVREAFIRLQKEELLTIVHQRYTRVSRIDLDRVHQECFIRKELELGNLQRFIPKVSDCIIAKMRELVDRQRIAVNERRFIDHVELDNQLHSIPFIETNEILALNILGQMNGHYDRMRLLSIMAQGSANTAIEEHQYLIDLLEQRNAPATLQMMSMHLDALKMLENDLIKNNMDFFQ